MTSEKIHLVGFGSQGSAWAQCLRTSGWDVKVYLRNRGARLETGFYSNYDSNSISNFKTTSQGRAAELGFQPHLLSELPGELLQEAQKGAENTQVSETFKPVWVALLCPDSEIPHVYDELLRTYPYPLRILLAHGYALYSQQLRLDSPLHQAFLLAPKAIGPKLLQNFLASFPNPHSLVAAISSTSPDFSNTAIDSDHRTHFKIARALGFDENSLVATSFEKEAIGDLISEQGLLCGGVFNLLDWTIQAMEAAEIPPALIREECLTELELIASLIREKGPASAFSAISQAAQAGTIAMSERLTASGFKSEFDKQMKTILTREFVNYCSSNRWKPAAEELKNRLESFEGTKK